MIGRITGTLIESDAGTLLVDVAGVAYEVEVSSGVLQGLPRVGEELSLHTHFIVREDAQLLYGFATKSERGPFSFPFRGPMELRSVATGTEVTNNVETGPESVATRLASVLLGPILQRSVRRRLHDELLALRASMGRGTS